MITRRTFATLLAAALILPVAACGKKGALEAPPNKDPGYPRKYPAAENPEDDQKS